MIKKLVGQMLAAQILSAFTVSVCLLIDNIMIGRFLGVEAVAAYGLANPMLLIIGALGSMLCAGAQVACSRSLGRGSQEETNAGYSASVVVAAGISVVFLLIVLIFREPVATLLGAHDASLLKDTTDYIAGFTIGAPASMAALILVPFLQMAGKSNLLIAAVLGMTISDIGFDLLNVLVFNGGMFGMGLASSLSYYVAVLIGGWYFFSKKCVFRFSFSLVKWQKIQELIAGGVPTVVGMAASVVLVFVMNKILMPVGGKAAVAAFAVANTILSASNCISTGSGGVALTLSGILYHEEDRKGLGQLLKVMSVYACVLGIIMGAVLFIFAPYFAGLFIGRGVESFSLAVTALRCSCFGLIPCCLNNVLKNSYQGTGRVKTMEVMSAMENLAVPGVLAFVLSSIIGILGAWFYFALGELITLLAVLICVWIKRRHITFDAGDILMLSDELGVPDEDLLESDIESIGDVVSFSRNAERFCREHGLEQRLCGHIALCIEEMGSMIVERGFNSEGRKNHLSIRLQHKKNRWILRFRDDLRAFDPLKHIPDQGDESGLGILLVMKLADDARYTYSLNLNNLTLELNGA